MPLKGTRMLRGVGMLTVGVDKRHKWDLSFF